MSYGEYLGAGSTITKALYHLNGNSNDSSGNGNNGTDTNITYSLANGKFGQGAGFNGTNSMITVNNATFDSSAAFTFSFWIKSTNSSMPFFKGYWSLFVRTNITNHRYEIGFSNTGSGITSQILTANNSLVSNTWQNIIVTSTGTNQVAYIDGNIAGTNSSTISNNSTSIGFGANILGPSEFLNGQMDEVIIENTAWSAQKVQKYYTYAKGRFDAK